ncbi:MAG: peptide ABC transporter substrate-binding protein [Trueperaceae bacterium]|nr:peptide ABC transporter substrate-binding protein [Trueperaceae bacterium]
MNKLAVLLLALVMSGAALAGPNDNSLIVGASQEPAALEPFVNNQAITAEIMGYMFPGFTRVNLEGDVLPIVAESIPTQENGGVVVVLDENDEPVSMTVRWTIREEAVYSDGTPIRTDSVALGYEIFGDPNLPVPDRTYYDLISDLNIIDDRTFEVTYEPVNLFYQLLVGFPVVDAPAHIWGPIWDDVQAQLADASPEQAAEIVQNELLGHPIATPELGPPVTYGAFQFVEWTPGASIAMERNPLFWLEPEGGADNYVQSVDYRFIQNTPTLLVNVLSGNTDALSSVGLEIDQLETLQRSARNVFDVYAVASSVWEHVEINKWSTVQAVADLTLDDVRTRQALISAMNRTGLVEEVFNGAVVLSNSFVNNSSPLFNPDVNAYPYDPERARELLAEVGWGDSDGNGLLDRTTEDGRTVDFVIEYVTVAGRADRERNQQYFCNDLREVGIGCSINNAPSSVVFDDAYFSRSSEGTWTGFFEFAWVSNPLLEDGNLYNCAAIPSADNGFSGNNIGNWCNEEYDALWEAAQTELDPEARAQLFFEMQEIWSNELPTIPLYQTATPVTVRHGLVNYTFNGPTQYPGWNAWEIGWEQNGAVQRVTQP